MSRFDRPELRTILLVEEIVDNPDLGVIASLIGIINRECRTRVPNIHPRVATVTSDIGILALCRCRGFVVIIVDISSVGRSAKSPGGIAGWLVLGLTEEPDRRVAIGEIYATSIEE
jgi:hypothetical protein